MYRHDKRNKKGLGVSNRGIIENNIQTKYSLRFPCLRGGHIYHSITHMNTISQTHLPRIHHAAERPWNPPARPPSECHSAPPRGHSPEARLSATQEAAGSVARLAILEENQSGTRAAFRPPPWPTCPAAAQGASQRVHRAAQLCSPTVFAIDDRGARTPRRLWKLRQRRR